MKPTLRDAILPPIWGDGAASRIAKSKGATWFEGRVEAKNVRFMAFWCFHMEVSWNGGTPKSSIF